MRGGWVGLLSATLAFPAPASLPSYRIGITRVGGAVQGPAERSVARWVENESLGLSAEVVANLTPLAPGRGPREQESLWRQAQAAWKENREDAAKLLLQKARALHPEGRCELPAEAGFREWAAAQPTPTRLCTFEFELAPAEATLQVDGFAFGQRRRLELPVGAPHTAWIEASGYLPREVKLDCQRPGQWAEVVRLETAGSWVGQESTWKQLQQTGHQQGLESWVLLREDPREGVRFYLHTPGVGTDPIPLEKPWLLANAEASSLESPPIAKDAFTGLVAKHRSAPWAIAPRSEQETNLGPANLQEERLARPAWYERKVFWIVAGAVAAGVVAAALASRARGSEVQSHPGVQIRID